MGELFLRKALGLPQPSQIERQHVSYVHAREGAVLRRILPRSILYKLALADIERCVWQARAHPKIADDERNAESGSRCTFSVIAMHFPQQRCIGGVKDVNPKSYAETSPDMNTIAFEDRPPDSAELTSYDERHLATYLRLLDADEEGADWKEAVKIIFGLDPDRSPSVPASSTTATSPARAG